jgi:hypothetical protein
MLQLPAMEADLFGALKDSALDVREVRADPAGLSNIAYAKIRLGSRPSRASALPQCQYLRD